jgi:hypothetical protein
MECISEVSKLKGVARTDAIRGSAVAEEENGKSRSE